MEKAKTKTPWLTDFILWVLASPILLMKTVIRFWHRSQFWRVAYAVNMPCRHCGQSISLVGMWRCACGYTYTGHVLRHCPVCGALPRMIRCFVCGNTELLPDHV